LCNNMVVLARVLMSSCTTPWRTTLVVLLCDISYARCVYAGMPCHSKAVAAAASAVCCWLASCSVHSLLADASWWGFAWVQLIKLDASAVLLRLLVGVHVVAPTAAFPCCSKWCDLSNLHSMQQAAAISGASCVKHNAFQLRRHWCLEAWVHSG
jgi:hypothetical protein